MDIFSALERYLRADNEYLNTKLNLLIEKCEDAQLLADVFEMSTFCNKYVQIMNQPGNTMTLWEMV